MSNAKPMDAGDREWNYTGQRKPGYVSAPHVLTARQWRRIAHKERRREDYVAYLARVWSPDAKNRPTPRRADARREALERRRG